MKLQFASDLHIEFPENKEFLLKNPLKPVGDILILGGDIVPFRQMDEYSDFFDLMGEKFRLTYWLPGNHEYYRSDLTERPLTLNEKVRDNIILVNNSSVADGKIRMIFSTLWSKISPALQYELMLAYSDFRIIRNNKLLLTIDQYNSMHQECLSFLTDELGKKFDGITIVITHHMPTFFNYPEEYTESPLREAFATELSDLIVETAPEYWIFGHYHNNNGDFNLGKTMLVTNQLGYVLYNEQSRFDPGKYIEI